MKTNIKNIIRLSLTGLCLLMATSVFLSSVHAKDLINQTPVKNKASALGDQAIKRLDDPAQKSINDLHSHTDKTMVKSLLKSISDNSSTAARREQRSETSSVGDSLQARFIEILLIWRLTLAYRSARTSSSLTSLSSSAC